MEIRLKPGTYINGHESLPRKIENPRKVAWAHILVQLFGHIYTSEIS
jgi:hypothetical protein